ncbi:MAG: hypothetical protein U0Q16_11635 [Bryobacteraceae bacterium]
MDLKVYFRQIREMAAEIKKDFVVVASKWNANGAKDGVLTEVSRDLAAKLIVDDKARLADDGETARYYQELQKAADKAQEEDRISKVQFAVLSEADVERLKKTIKSK